jgi:hypothetical protein
MASIDPRFRVLYLLAVAVGAFVLSRPATLGALLALQLALWFGARLGAGRLLRQLSKLWGYAFFIVASYALFELDPASDRVHQLHLVGATIPINVTGSIEGALMVGRLVAVVLASQIARAGDAKAIVAGLSQLRVPALIALPIDAVLGLLGEAGGGRGSGMGGGGGGGRGRRHRGGDADEAGFWTSLKRLGRGDVGPIVERLRRFIARAEDHLEASGAAVGKSERRDAAIIAGVALTMLAIKVLKVLPSLPFAPGHKMVLLTPLYIVAAMLTTTRFGATLTGLTMGFVAFLMGDGRYGIFELLKHLAPGVLCDALMPLMLRRPNLPGGMAWSLFGGAIGLGRFATTFMVTLALSPPALAYALLVPGLTANVLFGLMSGFVSYHLARAVREMDVGERSQGGGRGNGGGRGGGKGRRRERDRGGTTEDDAAQ